MTETNNNIPFAGLFVKPRKMPDFNYSRFQKWYTTSTWISSTTGTYKGHEVSGGRNFQPVAWARRQWHTSAPPTRLQTAMDTGIAFDLTTPYYMLADTAGGTASTEDTIVGPDYYNLPLRLNQDLIAMDAISNATVANERSMFMRTLAIKHQFTFVNYSRFPLEIYYIVLPVGHRFPTVDGGFDPHDDMSNLGYKKIVVPAVRDAADRGKKSTIDLAMNLKGLWPDAYDMPPGPEMTGTTQALSVDSRSPWVSLLPGATTSSVSLNMPPGQFQDDAWGSPDLATTKPMCGLRMQWVAKLQQPRDIGFTTEVADHAGGDFSGNNYDVHAKSSWLVDMYRTVSYHATHTGEKAYPSTAA